MSEKQMAQDVDDSFDGKGGWQSSGHEPTPLIDAFYDLDNRDIFESWYGDCVTDHDEMTSKVIQAMLVVLRTQKRNMAAQAQRGNWEMHAETTSKMAEQERKLGKFMYDLINNYMVEASERCK